MAASNPKAVLRKEKELLKRLATTARDFVQGLAEEVDPSCSFGKQLGEVFRRLERPR